MGELTPSSRVVRFGVFEVDLHAGELRKSGLKIKLQGQPFQILAILLERPGELVTREELQRKLWPRDTFVDYERGLNIAIKKLREALGDSAENPRFIETLPRRGYRLLVPVQPAGELRSSEGVSSEDSELRHVTKRKRPVLWAALVGIVSLFVVGLGLWYKGSRQDTESPSLPMRIIPVTSYPGEEGDPAISPDGKQIAFCWNGEKQDNFDIYVKLIGVGAPLRLTTHPSVDEWPTWSPDGRHIAFIRDSGEGRAYYVVPSLGGSERRIGESHSKRPAHGGPSVDWSPDGKFLAIHGQRSPEDPDSIFLLSADTGEKRQLTRPPARSIGDSGPAFSPDGKTLAFTRFLTVGVMDLYIVPTAGGQPRRLTFDNTIGYDGTWTSDGREIVFASLRGGSLSLWRISASGGIPHLLAGVGQYSSHPSISSQGDSLAYRHDIPDTDIWRVQLPPSKGQQAAPVRLISSTQLDVTPQFSPDGQRIALGSNRSGDFEIWVCKADGSHPVQLTSFAGPMTGTPRWSPDSESIVFDSRPGGEPGIFVVSVNGGSPRRLTTGKPDDLVPSWSRDGRWIYFASNRSGEMQVWKMPVAGGQPIQVTQKGGFEAFESPDGNCLYYSKQDVLDIWKVPTAGGDESQVLRDVSWRNWTVVEGGIYFIPANRAPAIRFLSFTTEQVTEVVPLDKPPNEDSFGALSVSPDGQWILCSLEEQRGSDIMLVENFH